LKVPIIQSSLSDITYSNRSGSSAIVFQGDEGALEKQGPDEQSDIGICRAKDWKSPSDPVIRAGRVGGSLPDCVMQVGILRPTPQDKHHSAL